MAQTPLEFLTVIAAPALITNASSTLVLSTSNRFARAVDRSRALAKELNRDEQDSHTRIGLLEAHRAARRRTLLLVRALTSFYVAVASFAAGSFTGLVGAGAEHFGYAELGPELEAFALAVITVGTLAIATGAALLVLETRMALHGLIAETRRDTAGNPL